MDGPVLSCGAVILVATVSLGAQDAIAQAAGPARGGSAAHRAWPLSHTRRCDVRAVPLAAGPPRRDPPGGGVPRSPEPFPASFRGSPMGDSVGQHPGLGRTLGGSGHPPSDDRNWAARFTAAPADAAGPDCAGGRA